MRPRSPPCGLVKEAAGFIWEFLQDMRFQKGPVEPLSVKSLWGWVKHPHSCVLSACLTKSRIQENKDDPGDRTVDSDVHLVSLIRPNLLNVLLVQKPDTSCIKESLLSKSLLPLHSPIPAAHRCTRGSYPRVSF